VKQIIAIVTLLIMWSCTTEKPQTYTPDISNTLRLHIESESEGCFQLIFYNDTNNNFIFDENEEQVGSFKTCPPLKAQYFYFFESAPVDLCSEGGLQVFLYLDTNGNQEYEDFDVIVDIQTFCF